MASLDQMAAAVATQRASNFANMTDAVLLSHVRGSAAWAASGGPRSRGKRRLALLGQFRAEEVAANLEAAAAFQAAPD